MEDSKVIAKLATLEEQGRWVTREVNEIKLDVKSLLSWKWRAIGAGAILGFIGGLLVEFIKR